MNSKKDQNRVMRQPLFKIDPETGKRILLPFQSSPQSNSKIKSSEKKSKKKVHLKPLILTPADFEELPQRATKKRKVDNNSVRKELFNVPSRRSNMSRPSVNTRRSISRRTSTLSKKVQPQTFKPCELSPLLDMEEVEEELIHKNAFLRGYPFKTPSKPAIKFSSNVKIKSDKKPASTELENIQNTPNSSSSNEMEFLKLEKMCGIEDPGMINECDKSPISSVCNLLEGTVINSTKKERTSKNRVLNIEQNVIKDIENIFIEYNSAFEEYKTSHEKNISKITDLLEADKNQYDHLISLQNKHKNSITSILNDLKCGLSNKLSEMERNKENTPIHNRRSIRLLNKSPIQSNGAKLIVSPAVLQSRDLRKSTLTKNLVSKSQQYNINSPRIKKALDMYNTLRCEISVLATPKLDRNFLNESPRSTNLSTNLSRKIQNQCLLLQDTPRHK